MVDWRAGRARIRTTARRVGARLRTIAASPRTRKVLIALGSLVAVLEWGALTFHVSCQGSAGPGPPRKDATVDAFKREFPEYARTEESTYLTLPEWYEVFSYQEYAEHVASRRPSGFPYFAAIGQFWSIYCHAYGETEGRYPFNAGNHLMIGVIGVSFTVEYALKGAYENTIGRLTELDSHTTPEDRYAADTAREYGQFVETRPWYEYPFGHRAAGVWTENDLFGADFLRKTERKWSLTVEYGGKAGYASVIRLATHAIFGPPPSTDYLWIENASADALAVQGVGLVRDLQNGSYVITLPHYQGFTDAVPELAARGVHFVDISGNDEIVLTVLAPRGRDHEVPNGTIFVSQRVVTHPELRRLVVRVPVEELHQLLRGLDGAGARVEHIFDY